MIFERLLHQYYSFLSLFCNQSSAFMITLRPNLYDYLKILAILTMIVDHLGYYFFPEILWLRLIGRIAFPLFLFLVGFSGSYRWRWDLLIWGLLLWIAQLAFRYWQGSLDFSFNILISILVARLVLRFFDQKPTATAFILINLFFLLLYPWFYEWMDYGSLAIFFALWGYLAKHQYKNRAFIAYGVWIFLLFLIQTIGVFDFGFRSGKLLMPMLLIGTVLLLFSSFSLLRKNNYPLRTHPWRDTLVLFISKQALLIYVLHILIFASGSFLLNRFG